MATKRTTNSETRKNAATTTQQRETHQSELVLPFKNLPVHKETLKSHQRAPTPEWKIFTTISPPLQSRSHPSEVQYDSRVTIRQIREAVNKSAPNKAPGPDEITRPNKVLKHTLPIIERHLQALMQASIDLGHFPRAFKETTTIVLRKPGKPDYTKAKAYRPIALENTLGKILESVMAIVISYLTEAHGLLPVQHFGGRPGRSVEDAMMILSESVYKAWKNKNVYTAIFMDVAGAFNNVHHKRLIHNLRMRHMPEKITEWIQSFLQERSTQLQFNGAKSGRISTPAGVPQGSPLSPLLYMYYNADLLDIASRHEGKSLGFIDDITYGIEGPSDMANVCKLNGCYRRLKNGKRNMGHNSKHPNMSWSTLPVIADKLQRHQSG